MRSETEQYSRMNAANSSNVGLSRSMLGHFTVGERDCESVVAHSSLETRLANTQGKAQAPGINFRSYAGNSAPVVD